MTDANANVAIGCAALLALWLVYHFVWKKTALDHFRQELYAIRDELFMEAARGRVSFDDPAYGMLRMLLNRSIRASRTLTFAHVFVAQFIRWVPRRQAGQSPFDLGHKLSGAIDHTPDPARQEIYSRCYGRMLTACVLHLLRSSIIAIATLFVTVCVFALWRSTTRGMNALKQLWGLAYATIAVDLDKERHGHLVAA